MTNHPLSVGSKGSVAPLSNVRHFVNGSYHHRYLANPFSPSHLPTSAKIDCSNVVTRKSTFSTPATGEFDGAFAKIDFSEGDMIEKGTMRRLPEGFDGMQCEFIFTWSTERPNTTWAMGSGCAAYYNTDKVSLFISALLTEECETTNPLLLLLLLS